MNEIELEKMMNNLTTEITENVYETMNQLGDDFQAPDECTNQEAEARFRMHQLMVQSLISQRLGSKYNALLDTLKGEMDIQLAEMGEESAVHAGSEETLWEDNVLSFSKKRNKDGVTVPLNEFKTQLRLLGVEESIVNKAESATSKPRKGNTYYIIQASD